MARETRPVIAINEVTGERREFGSAYAVGKAFGTNHTHVLISIMMGTSVKGWKVYDTPDNIRRRIADLEEQIMMLTPGIRKNL